MVMGRGIAAPLLHQPSLAGARAALGVGRTRSGCGEELDGGGQSSRPANLKRGAGLGCGL